MILLHPEINQTGYYLMGKNEPRFVRRIFFGPFDPWQNCLCKSFIAFACGFIQDGGLGAGRP